MERHPLLARQIRKILGDETALPPDVGRLLDVVSKTYGQYDEDVNLTNRALDISSTELNEAFEEIKEKSDKQRKTLDELKHLLSKFDGNMKIDEDESIYIIDAIKEQINRKKVAEAELKQLSIVASETINGVILSNAEGDIEWVNSSMEKICGFTKEYMIGKAPRSIYHDHDHPITKANVELIERYYHSPFPFNVTTTVKRADGNLRWISISNTPIFDDQENLIQQIEIITDITESKLNTDKIKQLLKSLK
ncbi:MAG: PAS domain-containing protein, partial [Crocinitomicaceae bacterium]|nr:PAS domain-containing protein [Crocinitomicaceae bacterium]